MTDKQWAVIEPLFVGMRNRTHSKRELLNALLYLMDSGCKWRQLPHDFPPYQAVYSFFRRAKANGLWDRLLEHMVKITRTKAGRNESPRYAIEDSQSVKTTGASEQRGIDGEKTKGRKRHIVVDTMGNLLSVVVHAANLHDIKSGILPFRVAYKTYATIRKVCADMGYEKPL